MPASDFKDRFKGKIGVFGADGKVYGIGDANASDGEEAEVEEKVVGGLFCCNRARFPTTMGTDLFF